MRILAISDLHGAKVDSLLNVEGVDMVLFLGDVTAGGSLEQTKERILPLRDAYPKIWVLPGNWERSHSVAWLEEEGLSLDLKTETFEGLRFFGIGGSELTPFNTPNEFIPEVYTSRISKCPQAKKDERLVICSHHPPYGVCDKIIFGEHVGSKSLREIIINRSPALVLCGHIHEARGQGMIGTSLIVNPGTAPKHHAIIDISKEISVKLE